MYNDNKTTVKYIAIGAGAVILLGGGIIGIASMASNLATPQPTSETSTSTTSDYRDTGTPSSDYTPPVEDETPAYEDPEETETPTAPEEPEEPEEDTAPEQRQGEKPTESEKRVSLNYSSLNLAIGKSANLTVTIRPKESSDKVTWSSSNTSVATVSNGKVTAKKAGDATITVTVNDKYKATCKVGVYKPSTKPQVVNPTGISLDKSSLTMTVGDSTQVKATVSPNNATNKSVTWSSDNKTVAKVSNGKITALKAGSTRIIAKTHNGKTASVRVYVKEKTIPVSSIRLNTTNVTIAEKASYVFTATVLPSNATNKTVTWTTSDSSIVSISGGKVTGKKVGKAIITAKAGNKSASATVVVKSAVVPVQSITLNKTSASINVGASVSLKATVKPDNATNKTVTWTTSSSTIATVVNGKVTGKKAGTVTITAKAGNKTATAKITVKEIAVTSVTLNKTTLSLNVGSSATLTATIKPTNATNKTVTWKSSNTSVATVSGGKITGKKAGTAKITATAGGKTATATVTVKTVAVTKVTLNKTSANVNVGSSVTLTATVSPSNATNKTVTWTTSDSKIATVSGGKVTGKKAGKVTITAKAGGKSAKATITVKTVAVTGISLNKTKATINKGASMTLTATVSPSNATNKTVTWTTSDSKIATVSGGKVTGKKAGKVTITAKAGGKTATATITVKVPVSSVTLNKTSASTIIGGSVTLTATVAPSDATSKTVTWTTSDSKIATVSAGKVTGVKAGKTTITATAGGKTATATITVYAKPSLSVGATTIMDEHSTTATAKNIKGTITYTSSDTSIFKVNSSGKITGKKPGSATLTVTAKNLAGGSAKLTKKITVRKIRLLTIGNSKTYYGDLNNKITQIATNRGYSIEHTSVTHGGWSIKQDYDKYTSKITGTAYDIAVLQQQADDQLFYNYTLSDVKLVVNALKKKNANVKIYLRKAWLVYNSNSTKMSAIDSAANKKLHAEYRESNARGGSAIANYLPVFKKRYNTSALLNGTVINASNKVLDDVASATGIMTIRDGDAIYAAKGGYPVFARQAQTARSTDVRHQSYLGGYMIAACVATKIFGIDPTTITTTTGIEKKVSDNKKYDDKSYTKYKISYLQNGVLKTAKSYCK